MYENNIPEQSYYQQNVCVYKIFPNQEYWMNRKIVQYYYFQSRIYPDNGLRES